VGRQHGDHVRRRGGVSPVGPPGDDPSGLPADRLQRAELGPPANGGWSLASSKTGWSRRCSARNSTPQATGPPIPPAGIGRLFRPFQRLAPSRRSHADGTGLGLSIVEAIADAHKATITAAAQPHGA